MLDEFEADSNTSSRSSNSTRAMNQSQDGAAAPQLAENATMMILPPQSASHVSSSAQSFSSETSVPSNHLGDDQLQQIQASFLDQSFMLQQQQMPQQPPSFQLQQIPLSSRDYRQAQENPSAEGSGSAPFDIRSELKRIQQLHQLGAGGNLTNALISQGESSLASARSAAAPTNDTSNLFQSMLDVQKIQNPRFDHLLAPSSNLGFAAAAAPSMASPLLQPLLFPDASRFLTSIAGAGAPNLMQFNPASRQDEVPLPSPHSAFHRDGSRRMRGGVIEPFPEKLHRMLVEVETAGRSDVISFVANGRAFAIHQPEKFFKEIVPLYFKQSRFSSFKRQLNLYGFELIQNGPAKGSYFHESFVRNQPDLCRRMRRVGIRNNSKSKPSAAATAAVAAAMKEVHRSGLDLSGGLDGNFSSKDQEGQSSLVRGGDMIP